MNNHKLLLVNNVLYLVNGRQGGIHLCTWPTQYKYIGINSFSSTNLYLYMFVTRLYLLYQHD